MYVPELYAQAYPELRKLAMNWFTDMAVMTTCKPRMYSTRGTCASCSRPTCTHAIEVRRSLRTHQGSFARSCLTPCDAPRRKSVAVKYGSRHSTPRLAKRWLMWVPEFLELEQAIALTGAGRRPAGLRCRHAFFRRDDDAGYCQHAGREREDSPSRLEKAQLLLKAMLT